jgi:hypothetical protein
MKTTDLDYRMPSMETLKKELYLHKSLYKPFQYDLFEKAVTPIGSPLTNLLYKYKSIVTNLRQPTVVFLAHYTYGLNNISQFDNREEVVVYQSLVKALGVMQSVTKYRPFKTLRPLLKLLEHTHTSIHFLAVYKAKEIRSLQYMKLHNVGKFKPIS